LDATTGQNAVQQTKLFKEVAGVSAIALTKLDGTAKGGVVVAVKEQEGVPVKYIGVGERIDDLQPFDPVAFSEALFSTEKA
ncbi:MAG TPA: signal recognition particle-docking protein FtsY, partial [Symbiobacteriaceae bacterium]|nr:signal recognition particle-docking protein FtsY [Symbiobacteriaceae bacterium]